MSNKKIARQKAEKELKRDLGGSMQMLEEGDIIDLPIQDGTTGTFKVDTIDWVKPRKAWVRVRAVDETKDRGIIGTSFTLLVPSSDQSIETL